MISPFLILGAYILCSVLHCAGLLTPKRRISTLTKPLLMPLLIAYYLLSAKNPNMLVVAALTAGFFGDVFLIFKGVFFLFGLFSFFIGHMLYITVLLDLVTFTAFQPWMAFPVLLFIAYGILIYRRLKPHIHKIKIAVIPYMIVLLSLSVFAFIYFIADYSSKGAAVLAGSLLFTISDSLLSFDMFVEEKKWRTVAVMATYTLAQGFLVTGLLK